MTLFAHGYGGAAPGTGPTLATHPVYFQCLTAAGLWLIGVIPNGDRFAADLSALWLPRPMDEDRTTSALLLSTAPPVANSAPCRPLAG